MALHANDDAGSDYSKVESSGVGVVATEVTKHVQDWRDCRIARVMHIVHNFLQLQVPELMRLDAFPPKLQAA